MTLYVREEYRKQGIAESLLEAAKGYGKSVQAKGFELSTAITNLTAQALYEKLGYIMEKEYYQYFLKVNESI